MADPVPQVPREATEKFDPHAQFCPACECEWWAGVVPDSDPVRHYSKVIGRVWHDRVQEWFCPNCNESWPRD